MVVSIDYDGVVQLMDSKSYKVFEVDQDILGNDIQQGDTIEVIKLDGNHYAIPKTKDARDG
jgi:NMD protein affecting ribosome stability and mRNA decay